MHGGERAANDLYDLIGDSPPMAELRRLTIKAAENNFTVLIQGESGTGKELVARAIHRHSSRSVGPFVAVNCAAVPEGLLESELFGYEKGAFTGAEAEKKGDFERAAGGTLFLDEIGELHRSIQAKLLRALQEKEIKRLGGGRPIPADIRIVAATNRNLEREVASRKFREDLYYRLNVFTIRTPALRDRREDIPVLARHFLSLYGPKCNPIVRHISDETLAILQKANWRGNVRELQNVVQYAVAMASTAVVVSENLPPELLERLGNPAKARARHVRAAWNETRYQLFEDALDRAQGDYRQAAELLGMHPNAVHRSLKKLRLTHLLK